MAAIPEFVLGFEENGVRNIFQPKSAFKAVKRSHQKLASIPFGCPGLDPGDANITCSHMRLEKRFGEGVDCTSKVPLKTQAFFVSCPPGYELVEDYQIITCKFPGKWDNDVFTCDVSSTTVKTTIKTTAKPTTKAGNVTKATNTTTIKPINGTTLKPLTTNSTAKVVMTTLASGNTTLANSVATTTTTAISTTTAVATTTAAATPAITAAPAPADTTAATTTAAPPTTAAPTTTVATTVSAAATTATAGVTTAISTMSAYIAPAFSLLTYSFTYSILTALTTTTTAATTTAATTTAATTTAVPTTAFDPAGYDNAFEVYSIYKIYVDGNDWNAAATKCQGDNAFLVVIDKPEEAKHVMTLTKDHMFFVGLQDREANGVFKSNIGVAGPNLAGMWAPGQPSNMSGTDNEECLKFMPGNATVYGLHDFVCWDGVKMKIVCEKKVPV